MEQSNEEEIVDDSEQETLDFSKPDFEFKPTGNCMWRQFGPYLSCSSCEIKHFQFIGVDKIMVGIDKDGPILKDR